MRSLMDRKRLDQIPRGNTCPGVNRLIIERLLSAFPEDKVYKLLDVPCGGGEFLDAVKDFFPAAITFGADNADPSTSFSHAFLRSDAAGGSAIQSEEKFDVITCISGVMEFDNTLSFFRRLRSVADSGAILFVTNDNLVSVRDRFLYLLFGRLRQYRLAIPPGAPTWKILPLQNLMRILIDADFEILRIEYVSPKPSDWIWSPLAALVFAFQYAYTKFGETRFASTPTTQMFPFNSLLSRHYVVKCKVRP
ncbi:MAG TPA: methyltransferase domain-containing protein [Pyrinomonadaceae bacterium]|nr:methyltransferase domain-containing protein [Pyrinomonadaceae bacterium]